MKTLNKREILLMTICCNNLFTKEEYEEKIRVYEEYDIFELTPEYNYPTYEEYLEYYIKDGFKFFEMFTKQKKKIVEFQIWLLDNKGKTFTYDEIKQKLLDLELAFDGFNGGLNIEGNK
ncbi:MAG: hypothetical protein IKT40_03400 [Bacilli bacterium]|nr:hypothetical protein [Bacilli bacterium]